ncbi:MAG: glycerol-3-phosphate 1-O-acyltransferase PlsY [Leadbetterella sp.]
MIFGLYALAFVIGSIPSAYLYAKKFHDIDITKHGSGNSGATNSLRVLGKKAGAIVLIADLLKGMIPTLATKFIYLDKNYFYIVGLFTVFGHIFSIFMKFKGGKGVATSLGVILACSPLGGLVCIAVFASTVFVTRIVSLGSMLGALGFVLFTFILYKEMGDIHTLSISLFTLVVFSHRKNLRLIQEGKENKI